MWAIVKLKGENKIKNLAIALKNSKLFTHVTDRYSFSPLELTHGFLWALEQHNQEGVKFCIRGGILHGVKDTSGYNFLLARALMNQNLEAVTYLLTEGIEPTLKGLTDREQRFVLQNPSLRHLLHSYGWSSTVALNYQYYLQM